MKLSNYLPKTERAYPWWVAAAWCWPLLANAGHVVSHRESLLSLSILCGLVAYPHRVNLFRAMTVLLSPALLYWTAFLAVMGGFPSAAAVQAAVGTTASELRDGMGLGLAHATVLVELVLLTMVLVLPTRPRTPPAWHRLAGTLAFVSLAGACVHTRLLTSPAIAHPGLVALEAVDSWVGFHLLQGRQAPTPLPHVRPGVFVFVVGESARWDAFFGQEAAPGSSVERLRNRLKDPSQGWSLPPVCASANGTYRSVPLLLTGYSPAEASAASTAPSWIGRAWSAGARTVRLSNQSLDVYTENVFDTVVPPPQGTAPPDGWLVTALDKELSQRPARGTQPLVILLHLTQAHFEYFRRYPGGESAQRTEDEHYDQAIEYSAKVLLDVMSRLDALPEPGVLVFTSDHGEGLPRDGTGLLRHLGPDVSPAEVWVPGFIAYNREGAAYAPLPEQQPPRVAHRSVTHLFGSALTGEPFMPTGADVIQTHKGTMSCGTFPLFDTHASRR